MKKLLLLGLIVSCSQLLLAQYVKPLPDVAVAQQNELKSLAAGCQIAQTATELSLNNVRTWVHPSGLLWYHEDHPTYLGYEVPQGSGLTSIYFGGLVVGGIDPVGVLKVAAIRTPYTRNYWPGPLVVDGSQQGTTDVETCYQYDRIYEVSRYQVAQFNEWYHQQGDPRYDQYQIPASILDWPAHGDAAAGYDYYLAPFWDNNDDGLYNPADGDYPFFDLDGSLACGKSRHAVPAHLYGDQAHWWVFNDNGNLHSSPTGEGIGLEVRAQAFQYSTQDELNDMTFYHFDLINRSSLRLMDAYIGLYVDGEIGFWGDDYAACDVTRGLGYYYNGTEVDESPDGLGYGSNPPALGFDFFEGPYQDANGIDDCTSYSDQGQLICNECIGNGNINGQNFGDGIIDNERLGMGHYLRWNHCGGVGYDPLRTADAFYQALQGKWRTGEPLRYFGDEFGREYDDGPITRFMFPGDSDPCGWGTDGVVMPPWLDESERPYYCDNRSLMSAGPLTLEPGAVNDMTIGVVWARSYEGGLFASVDKMLEADEKAQRLFDNCFEMVDGPDAPELTIREEDQKLIFHIWNKASSNNYLEGYSATDPYIICPDIDPDCDTEYRFQGYQVWQLAHASVSVAEALSNDDGKARLIFQCDIRDGVTQLINYEWNKQLQANVPRMMVQGKDEGISHSFVVSQDLFAKPSQDHLINFRDYYYVAIAYAHNGNALYDQSNPEAFAGQKTPYKASRKGAEGPVPVYQASPHKPINEMSRNLMNVKYADSPVITQLEGQGSGIHVIDLTEETHDAIMKGPPWRSEVLKYEQGKGPISVSVVDPLSVVSDIYWLQVDSCSYFDGSIMNGRIVDANWFVYNSKGDTVFSESTISRNYDQLILPWGLSINFTQQQDPFLEGAVNNGFLEATLEFENQVEPWLWFLPDDDRNGPRNWIRAGTTNGDYAGDPTAVYEGILGGTWAPLKQCYIGTHGLAYGEARAAINPKRQRLASVDLYITSDRTKWTRSPVIETGDEELLSIGNVDKFQLRAAQSIDKYGNPAAIGAGADTSNTERANYISETGMGWFPGYAIDVNTGDRLNIIYGESSWLTGDQGNDMIWNPSSREGSKLYHARGELGSDGVYFGGKHFIYIMGHNQTKTIRDDLSYFPAYDAGAYFMERIRNHRNRNRLRDLYSHAMWCAVPLLDSTFFEPDAVQEDPYGFVKSDLKIRLRVVNQYAVGVYDFALPDSLAQNENKPLYSFNTGSMGRLGCSWPSDEDRLDLVNIVPNPYYGAGAYGEDGGLERIKIINLPEECTISIFTLNGNLIKRQKKNDDQSFVNWDMKNQNGLFVAPGVYIIHVDAPGVGERVLKWFGAW